MALLPSSPSYATPAPHDPLLPSSLLFRSITTRNQMPIVVIGLVYFVKTQPGEQPWPKSSVVVPEPPADGAPMATGPMQIAPEPTPAPTPAEETPIEIVEESL